MFGSKAPRSRPSVSVASEPTPFHYPTPSRRPGAASVWAWAEMRQSAGYRASDGAGPGGRALGGSIAVMGPAATAGPLWWGLRRSAAREAGKRPGWQDGQLGPGFRGAGGALVRNRAGIRGCHLGRRPDLGRILEKFLVVGYGLSRRVG